MEMLTPVEASALTGRALTTIYKRLRAGQSAPPLGALSRRRDF